MIVVFGDGGNHFDCKKTVEYDYCDITILVTSNQISVWTLSLISIVGVLIIINFNYSRIEIIFSNGLDCFSCCGFLDTIYHINFMLGYD